MTKRRKKDKIGAVPVGGIPTQGVAVGVEEITNRLKRIEGQVRGLQRMVEESRDCEAILTQLMAARAALDRVGLLVVEGFVHECLQTADGDLARERVGRVLEMVFSRFSVASVDEAAVSPVSVKPVEEE